MMLHIEFNWLDQAKNLRHGNVSLLIFWAPVSNEATCSLPCQHEAISEEQAASLRKKKRNLFILKRCQTGNLLISVSSQGSFKYFVYAPWCHCFKNQKDNPVQTRLKSVPKAPSQCLHSLHPAKHREKKKHENFQQKMASIVASHPPFWYGHSLPRFSGSHHLGFMIVQVNPHALQGLHLKGPRVKERALFTLSKFLLRILNKHPTWDLQNVAQSMD